MKRRFAIFAILLPLMAQDAAAWGSEGHQAIGALALDHMTGESMGILVAIMGTDDRQQIVDWCNWPDEYRASDEGAWSAPQHYINMVSGESQYVRDRDCPDTMCVTESILKYAAELQDAGLPDLTRRQAFGRVCHFVGDLNQPLHAGFGHDRGGNDFAITYRGKKSDLHTFFDHTLIEQHTNSWIDLYRMLPGRPDNVQIDTWKAEKVVDWTNEAHALAENRAYPDGGDVNDEFAERSWQLVLDQLVKGGVRLAVVLNTALAESAQPEPDCNRGPHGSIEIQN